MTPERYQLICDIFAEAKDLPVEMRRRFIETKCADDEDLKKEVEAMLTADAESGEFIENTALEAAAEILADEQNQTKIGRVVGHYTIVAPLGTGGMGEVWLAEDARLKRRVALKLLSAAPNDDFAIRFEQEAHAASALNHPNIITIFDIGHDQNGQFIATEYIEGKTLRQMIREKSIRISDAVEIALQVSRALAAAHQAGIVHRDIKPENIMRRNDGIVKILDFGLARFSIKNTSNPDAKFITKPGTIMGTVAYMSPEQARALPIEESTDVFSLGIVLYEMLSGDLPFDGVNEIEMLAAILEREPPPLNDSIPDTLKRIVNLCLIKSPFERPTAAEIVEELRHAQRRLEHSTDQINPHKTENLHDLQTIQMRMQTGNTPVHIGKITAANKGNTSFFNLENSGAKIFTVAALVLLLALGSFGIYQYRAQIFGAPAVLAETDKLLIADFVNKTGDEEFDGIFRQPLAVALAQSPFVALIPDGQIRQTLKQMEKPAAEPVTADIAREIAQRRGAKAYLVGSIENHGVKYLLTLDVFNAETNASIARQQVESANKETVLDSLDEAATEIRKTLGESLASVEKYDMPLKTSTTASLDALRAYTLATKSLSDGKTEEGITFYKQAAEIDPNYAGAYASLAAAYSNKGEMTTAAEYAEKAFALRDRLTEREKQKVVGFYYVFVTGEIDKDIENLEAAKLIYPRDNIYPLNLGASYSELGKFAKAEENARAALALDPTLFFAISNVGKYLIRQSRFDEAKVIFKDAAARNFDNKQVNENLFNIAYVEKDRATMEEQLKILEGKDKISALKLQANAALGEGKRQEYEKLVNQTIAEEEKDAPDSAADFAVQAARNFAALDECSTAEKLAARALKLDRGHPILTDAALAYAVCQNSQTENLIAELKQRFPKNTVVNSLWLPVIRAAEQMNSNPERALESLEINRQFQGATNFWDNYLRGKIYQKLNRPELAEAEFRLIAENRGWAIYSPLYNLALSQTNSGK